MAEYTKEYDLEDYGTEETSYRIEVSAQVYWEDQGIGSYEFWGSSGYHSEVVAVVEDLKVVRYLINDEEVTPDADFVSAAQDFLSCLEEDFLEMAEDDGPSSYDPEDYTD